MVVAGQAQVTDGLLRYTRGLTCVSAVELRDGGETSGCVTRKINMAAMHDGRLGRGVSFLVDSLPKVGVFRSQQ